MDTILKHIACQPGSAELEKIKKENMVNAFYFVGIKICFDATHTYFVFLKIRLRLQAKERDQSHKKYMLLLL